METITRAGLNIKVMLSEDQIQARINEMANQINEDFKGETVTLISVLTGGIMFSTDLAKRLDLDVIYDFIDISSYGEGDTREKSGDVKLNRDLLFDIEGKNIIVVEDIIDTGKSIKYLREFLNLRKPKSLKICSLLNKQEKREVEDLVVEYIGFEIENKFVVGYGLDYDQKLRNLPYIGEVVNN